MAHEKEEKRKKKEEERRIREEEKRKREEEKRIREEERRKRDEEKRKKEQVRYHTTLKKVLLVKIYVYDHVFTIHPFYSHNYVSLRYLPKHQKKNQRALDKMVKKRGNR